MFKPPGNILRLALALLSFVSFLLLATNTSMFSGTSSPSNKIDFLAFKPSLINTINVQTRLNNLKKADKLTGAEFNNEFRVYSTEPGYMAIKSLVEHYGCMSVYSDGTFRPRVELIRSEFVVELDICLNRISNKIRKMVGAKIANLASKKDVVEVKTLIKEVELQINFTKPKW